MISVLLGKTKIKTDKLHLAPLLPKPIPASVLFFAKCWGYKWMPLSVCIAQGQTWLGKKGQAGICLQGHSRYKCLLALRAKQGLVFPLG